MLIPMYLLIGIWGGERRIYAAVKFVLYTAVGSSLMLAAVIYLVLRTRHPSRASFAFGSCCRPSCLEAQTLLLTALP